ncbi:MAG TPA: VWA domain-containing protein [Pyrinomonadaceae bacterium]|nr:VWA domain-containing protein [Pyrinomonadaceae bacterium]
MFLPAVSLPPNSTTLCARRKRLFLSVCLLNLCVLLVTAQSLAQEPSADDEVLRVNTDLLLFPIRIRDKRGQAVTSLTERDLTLKDQDKVTAGLYFSQGIDRVALVFALDQSGSTREIISLQRDAAVALFTRFNERSKIAVIRFAGKPTLVVPFGRDAAAAREAFNFSSAANQPTAIFDAAATALNAFEELPPVRSERRIVILISDGLDNASTTKPNKVIEAAASKRVSFYVIHLPLFEPRDGRLSVRPASKGFKELAEKTNGKYFLVDASPLLSNKTIDLKPTFQAIEDDLRNQYLLGFYLGENANDGRKHRFSLSLPAGFEYQMGPLGYSRTQEFFVNRPRQVLKITK